MKIIVYYNISIIQILIAKKIKGVTHVTLLEQDPEDITVRGIAKVLKNNFTKKELSKATIILVTQEGVSNLKIYSKEEVQDLNLKTVTSEYKHLKDKIKKVHKKENYTLILYYSKEIVRGLVEEFMKEGITVSEVVPDTLSIIEGMKLSKMGVSNPYSADSRKRADINLLVTGSKVLAVVTKEGERPSVIDTKVNIPSDSVDTLVKVGMVYSEMKDSIRQGKEVIEIPREKEIEFDVTSDMAPTRTLIVDTAEESNELNFGSIDFGSMISNEEDETKEEVIEFPTEIVLNITEGQEITATISAEEEESIKEQISKIPTQVLHQLKIIMSNLSDEGFVSKVYPNSLELPLLLAGSEIENVKLSKVSLEKKLNVNNRKYELDDSVFNNPPMILMGALVSI